MTAELTETNRVENRDCLNLERTVVVRKRWIAQLLPNLAGEFGRDIGAQRICTHCLKINGVRAIERLSVILVTDDCDNICVWQIDAEFDESGAIDMELEAGEAVMIHYNMAHSSAPNRSSDRRMGMLIDCVSTRAVKTGNRESAMLVRGVDDTGNWDLEEPPETDLGVRELTAHRGAVELVTETFYAGSGRTPEAPSGNARNVV